MQGLQEPKTSSIGGYSQYQRTYKAYEDADRDHRAALWMRNGIFIVAVVLAIVTVIGSLAGFFVVANQIVGGLITTFLGGSLLTAATLNERIHFKRVEAISNKLDAIAYRDQLRGFRDITSDQATKEEFDRRLRPLDDLIQVPSDDNQDKIAPLQKRTFQKQETPQKLEEQIQTPIDYKDGYGGIS